MILGALKLLEVLYFPSLFGVCVSSLESSCSQHSVI